MFGAPAKRSAIMLSSRPEKSHLLILLIATVSFNLCLIFFNVVFFVVFEYKMEDGQSVARHIALWGTLSTVIILAVCLWHNVAIARSWSFDVSQQGLTARYGFVVHYERSIPVSRIQYTDVMSSPAHRYFGVVDLAIFTPGAMLPVIKVPCLTPERAQHLRDMLDPDHAAHPQ